MSTTKVYEADSPTEEILKGNWNIIKGRLKQKYAKLTDNDLRYDEGQEEEFIGRLQKCTGQTREELDKAIREIARKR